MIPKIIHQLWIGPKPPPFRFMDTWKEKNPDWEYRFWNEEELAKHFPSGLSNQIQYDQMPEWNGKCDIARYEILEMFGGFFIDADSICVNPLDGFFLDNDSFSCYENETARGTLVAAGYLASTKQNELMKFLIEAISYLTINGGPSAWQSVGPVLLTKTIAQHAYDKIKIYPSHYFIPEHYAGITYSGRDKIYAKQFWGSTVGSAFHGYREGMMDELLT